MKIVGPILGTQRDSRDSCVWFFFFVGILLLIFFILVHQPNDYNKSILKVEAWLGDSSGGGLYNKDRQGLIIAEIRKGLIIKDR